MAERTLHDLLVEASDGPMPHGMAPAAVAEAQRRIRRRRVGAVCLAVAVSVAVGGGLGPRLLATTATPGAPPAPAQGGAVVGAWRLLDGPVVRAAGTATEGCRPTGSRCPGFYVEFRAVNGSDMPLSSRSITATGGFLDGSDRTWRAECYVASRKRSVEVVAPGDAATFYCDGGGEVLESIESVDPASVELRAVREPA